MFERENRYITRIRANSFKFIDSKNKNIDSVAVEEVEENYYDSYSLFSEVETERGLSVEELPF